MYDKPSGSLELGRLYTEIFPNSTGNGDLTADVVIGGRLVTVKLN